MADRTQPGRSLVRRLAREVGAALLPAAIGVGLFLVLPGDTRSQAEHRQGRAPAARAQLCQGWHRGTGEVLALDLDRVKRAYADLKNRLTRSLEAARPEASMDLRKPYDSGLPACRGEDVRSVAVPREQGARLRGRTIYFASASTTGRVDLPPEVAKDPGAQILITRARSLADLPEIARALGRPVALGTAEFAKSLGVRCAGTWVRVTEKGDALELHESR